MFNFSWISKFGVELPCFTSISSRLHLVGALSLLAVWSLTYVSIQISIQTRNAAEELFTTGFVGMSRAAQLQLLLEKQRRIIESAPAEVNWEALKSDRTQLAKIAEESRTLAGAVSTDFRDELVQSLEAISNLGDKVMLHAESFAQDSAVEAAETYSVSASRLQRRIQTFRDTQVNIASGSVNEIVLQTRTLIMWVSGIGGLVLILLTPISLLITRRVLSRLHGIVSVMRQLAQNDTSVGVPSLQDADEVGDMARTVEVFKANAIDRNRQQRELNSAKIQLDAALDNMAHGVSMFDGAFKLLVCNPRYGEIYHLPPEVLKPGTPFELIQSQRAQNSNTAQATADQWLGTIHEMLAAGKRHRVTRELGDGRVIEISYQPLVGGGWVAVHEDITARRKTQAKVEFMARHDALTGLANRAQFRESLEQAVADLDQGRHFSVFGLDLDHFKQVNDTLGHAAGDLLLKSVSERLQSSLRKGDVVSRLGGDEFAIIQFDTTDPQHCHALAKRITDRIVAPYNLAGQEAVIGVSIGIAMAPGDGSDAENLLKRADTALYAAKGEGRGTYRFFDAEMDKAAQTRRTLEQELRKAVAEGGLQLHYQPLVNLSSGQITGFEALLRWPHPVRGMVSPGDFIPLAEETGLIGPIGEWVLRQACADAVQWPASMRVAVNLSPVQFKTHNLSTVVVAALVESGLSPTRLELEITESVLLLEEKSTIETLHQIRKLGVSIAMDDFGTGYSSLSYLRSFPFDKIKIDQTFVRDLSKREDCVTIVSAIAGLASSLKMRTVAEGVETEDQAAKVRSAGCTEAQGWLFGRPIPADRIAGLLERHSATAIAA